MVRNLGRWRSTDMLGLASPGATPRRGRDQGAAEGEEESGELLCRLAQTGADRWHGTTPDGKRLAIRRIGDGSLEIRHLSGGEDAADPDVVGEHPGAVAGPVAWGRSSDPASAATGDSFSRYVKSGGRWEHHVAALSSYQDRLNAYYGK